jgi:adenine-specific DNA-methyltransferase
MSFESINPFDQVRQSLNDATSREERSMIGQFLTPVSIADFMASLFKSAKKDVRILDPGAGAGVLFSALISKLVAQIKRPSSIEVVAYETDRTILPLLRDAIVRCSVLCEQNKVPFTGTIKEEDFIAAAISATEDSLFATPAKPSRSPFYPPNKKTWGYPYSGHALFQAWK